MSEKLTYRGKQKALGELSRPILQPIERKRGFGERHIITHWPHIVGQALAAHCLPEKVKHYGDERVLVIRCDSAWALEVQHLEPLIKEKIALSCGYQAVTRLQIRQAPMPVKPAANQQAMDSSPPQTLDDALIRLQSAYNDKKKLDAGR